MSEPRLPVEAHRPRLPRGVARAAASPSAIVLAGAGVAVGELAHLGLAVTIVLGAASYGARLLWAAVRPRRARNRAARRHRQATRVDPWSVPEPWRGFARRALDARKELSDLAGGCRPGPVADQLQVAASKSARSVQDLWQLARSGATLAGPAGRTDKVAQRLQAVQASLAGPEGPHHPELRAQEAALASELRSSRRLDDVASQVAERLGGLCSQLEGLVATAGQLALNAGGVGTELADLSTQLSALNDALADAVRALPADGYAAPAGGTGGASSASQP
jgi:hypothetical protein